MCECSKNVTKETGGCEVKRSTAAQEVVEFAIAMAEFSRYVESRVYKKLEGVMMSAAPSSTDKEPCKDREFPPLFGELRAQLQEIQTSLSHIDWAIDRTEL